MVSTRISKYEFVLHHKYNCSDEGWMFRFMFQGCCISCCRADEDGSCCRADEDGSCFRTDEDGSCFKDDEDGSWFWTDEDGSCFRTDEDGSCFRADEDGSCFRTDEDGSCFRADEDGSCFRADEDGSCFRADEEAAGRGEAAAAVSELDGRRTRWLPLCASRERHWRDHGALHGTPQHYDYSTTTI